MMRKSQTLICIMILTLSIMGCAVPVKKPPESIVTPKESFLKDSLQKGKEYEVNGDLVKALKQYKVAMTIDPSNQEAYKGRNRAEKGLRSLAKKHYKAGLEFDKKGKYGLARQQFLIALRLWPDYPEVVDILTSKKRFQVKRYIVHTIKPGESLSKVAKQYYGDYHKFPIIAKYNNLTDATHIKVGQKIRVPVIEGKKFFASQRDILTERLEIPEEGEVLKEESVDQVAVYRDHGINLFIEKKYQEAIIELKKVLNVNPDDNIALEYIYKSYFQQALAIFEKEDYLAARDQFKVCLRYKKNCQKCHGYIAKCEDSYKEMHYKRGMKFFDEEKLDEAIGEWNLVKAQDPHYKRVDYLITKAEKISKKIEELKKDQEKKE